MSEHESLVEPITQPLRRWSIDGDGVWEADPLVKPDWWHSSWDGEWLRYDEVVAAFETATKEVERWTIASEALSGLEFVRNMILPDAPSS